MSLRVMTGQKCWCKKPPQMVPLRRSEMRSKSIKMDATFALQRLLGASMDLICTAGTLQYNAFLFTYQIASPLQ